MCLLRLSGQVHMIIDVMIREAILIMLSIQNRVHVLLKDSNVKPFLLQVVRTWPNREMGAWYFTVLFCVLCVGGIVNGRCSR